MMQFILILICCLLTFLPSPAITPVMDQPDMARLETRPAIGQSIKNSTVSEDGEYMIIVPHRATVGPGPSYIFWQFNLLKGNASSEGYYKSRFLADVQPVTDEMTSFAEDFDGASAYITERANEMFGALLKEISLETVITPDNASIYVMRVRLDDGSFPMSFTATWRFEKSYMASFLGVNLGDKPDMDAIVLEAAAAFQDNTAAAGTADPKTSSHGTFSYDAGPWDLPVKNILGVIGEYAQYYSLFRIEPHAEETAILWTHN